MTEETPDLTPSTEPILGARTSDRLDVILTLLVDVINDEEMTDSFIGITLDVGGRIVTGKLVGFQRWWDAMTGMLDDAAGADGSSIARALRTIFDEADQATDEDDASPPSYIHLLDAVVVGQVAHPHPWRFRIAAVDGWTFGMSSEIP